MISFLFSIGIATICSIFYPIFFEPLFFLNENQLLYLFSAMAQVIGALFGLTLTAYIFFVERFKESTKRDSTLYDAASALMDQCFYRLTLISIISGSTIFLCITSIIALNNWFIIYPFLINESTFLFLIGTLAILIFGIQVFDPKKLDREFEQIRKDSESYYGTAQGDFAEFLQSYNLMESLIKQFAQECLSQYNITTDIYKYNQKVLNSNYRPQIIQSLNVLLSNEIINTSVLDEINRLRRYRNSIVHSSEKIEVAESACNRISRIYNVLKDAFTIYKEHGKSSAEWKNAVQKIYNLSTEFLDKTK